jgi:hypothetical protein
MYAEISYDTYSISVNIMEMREPGSSFFPVQSCAVSKRIPATFLKRKEMQRYSFSHEKATT